MTCIITPDQLQALRDTSGIATRAFDAQQSQARVQELCETKYRNETRVLLSGKHLEWADNPLRVYRINPMPGTCTKNRGPKLLSPAVGITLAAQVLRIEADLAARNIPFQDENGHPFDRSNGKPYPDEAPVYIDWTTGKRASYHAFAHNLKVVGTGLGTEDLTETAVRKAVMTGQLFLGITGAKHRALNDHACHTTDWIYQDPNWKAWEKAIYAEYCRTGGITSNLEPGCCGNCGDLVNVGTDLLCRECGGQGRNPLPSDDERIEALVALAADLEATLPAHVLKPQAITVEDRTPNAAPPPVVT